jgi:glycosyltransferase involved in cell wall biosynthesis
VLVSNQCGCYPDIVQDGLNGFSFDLINEDELFGFMEDITKRKHDLEAMSRASLEIIKEYTSERSADAFRQAIESVAGIGGKE